MDGEDGQRDGGGVAGGVEALPDVPGAGEQLLLDPAPQVPLDPAVQPEPGAEGRREVAEPGDARDRHQPPGPDALAQCQVRAADAERVGDDGVEGPVRLLEAADHLAVLQDRGRPAARVPVAGGVEGDRAQAEGLQTGDEGREARGPGLPAVHQQDGPGAVAPAVDDDPFAVDGQLVGDRAVVHLALGGADPAAPQRAQEEGEGRATGGAG